MPVDALDPTWIDAPGGVGPTYNSEELRRDMGFLLAGGASPDVSRTGVLDTRALTVSLSGSNVQINPGGCAVGTGKGAYLSGVSATVTVDALVAADVTNPRRDRVVLEILDPDNGGGAGRKAQVRVITGTPSATAASGGGYPAAPTSPSITLAYVDVPKSGNGSPSVTDQRPYTAAAGAAIPVRDATDRGAVTAVLGRRVVRLDAGGVEERYDGANWFRNGGPHAMAAGAAAIGIVGANVSAGPFAQTFPTGRFSVAPVVTVTTDQARIIAVAADVTATGFNLYLQNVTGTASANGNLRWTAVQMTPTSAAG